MDRNIATMYHQRCVIITRYGHINYALKQEMGHLLTGHAKLKGKTILDFSLRVPLVENLFPPRTGVDPVPKLQAPAAETRD